MIIYFYNTVLLYLIKMHDKFKFDQSMRSENNIYFVLTTLETNGTYVFRIVSSPFDSRNN